MSAALVPPYPASESQDFSLAPRGSRSLNGKVVGLLDSSKFNSDQLLEGIGQLLNDRYAIKELVRDRKGYFGRPIPEGHARNLASRCDVLITAIGD